MKIAIISDIHDNTQNLKKAICYIKEQKINILFHAGDTARATTLEVLGNSFHGNIYAVSGNADLENLKNTSRCYPKMIFEEEVLELEINKIKIAITHTLINARRLAKTGQYHLVVHGHTHKPWQEFIGTTEILCPGCITYDDRYQPTFAIYNTETKKPVLIKLANLT